METAISGGGKCDVLQLLVYSLGTRHAHTLTAYKANFIITVLVAMRKGILVVTRTH